MATHKKQPTSLRSEARASCALDGQTQHDCRCQCGERSRTHAEIELLNAAMAWYADRNDWEFELPLRIALEDACALVCEERR